MANAKKLPSGQWRTLVYSHSELVYNADGSLKRDKDGKPAKKRVYESFTADSKKESEWMATRFQMEKDRRQNVSKLTLRECIDQYIKDCDGVLSESTVHGYRIIQQNAFQDSIMDMPIRKLTNSVLAAAVNTESGRLSTARNHRGKTISAKTVANEYGLITAVINRYAPGVDCTVKLPQKKKRFHELSMPEQIVNIIRGTEIELPVLLSMWLTLSMSEIKGLTKSKSIQGDYLIVKDVMLTVNGKEIIREVGKQPTRNRKHRIPPYIKNLIDEVETDQLVTMSGKALYHRWTRILEKNGLPHMTFHDLRHVSASVMALLRIPDKYAQERGGWATDHVMKSVYMETFSQERVRADDIVDNYFEETCNMKCNTEKKEVAF